jgi:hypothetical protein
MTASAVPAATAAPACVHVRVLLAPGLVDGPDPTPAASSRCSHRPSLPSVL